MQQVMTIQEQVYQFLKEDICSGVFRPGQRLQEVSIANQYKVSRSPVREALRRLAADGLVERIDYHETPPRVEYRLTPDGEDLMPIFDAIQGYIRKRMGDGHEFSPAGHTMGEN